MMQLYPLIASIKLASRYPASRSWHRTRRLVVGAFLALAAIIFMPGQWAHANEESVQPMVSRVNINTADAKTLAAGLKGVGESRAEEIVRYREAFGPFASADELMEVKGIGKATLDLNRKLITLE